ncbi:histidine kinase N-terminal domain-containing protein [Naumannella cuiyingiana]|uniref:histidine kinase n=1 Tax=Naumannella cuiyingiana TaxID=1347891 RepID=A0A7Z0IJT5_9ACTN|nr:two-component sensor histidine kinase [Naumannella cuiyingiana]
MATLSDQLDRLGVDPATAAWLERLVGDWHLIADLSFSDLVLWLPDADDPNIFRAVAQVRPATGPTALEDDVVGDEIAYEPDSGVVEAYLSAEPVETSDNKLQAGIPVDQLALPVRRPCEVAEHLEAGDFEEGHFEGDADDEVRADAAIVAVIERHTNQMNVRAPSTLEDNYLEIAEILTWMLQAGDFPIPGEPLDPTQSLRVGDGLIRLDAGGRVTYATPNATTAFRRLGLTKDLMDERLADVTARLVTEQPQQPVAAFLAGGTAREMDLVSGAVVLRLRVLPLRGPDGPLPPIVLCKDISELRRRERQLVTKDATIREIHHRVKNNLQTVAALLRMQGRRIDSPEARAALAEAMSRVAAIAVVHETLSQSYDEVVDFDEVADRVLRMVADVSRASRSDVRVLREGSFGRVPATVATPLSLVVTELCQNAIEHGFGDLPGTVLVRPRTDAGELTVEVCDDGQGLPSDFDPSAGQSLGLSIVDTLVRDLGGSFVLEQNPAGQGSRAVVRVPVVPPDEHRAGNEMG